LPQLLRDAQVLPIWEGTTNVFSLDTLRALRDRAGERAVDSPSFVVLREEVFRSLSTLRDPRLKQASEIVRSALGHAEQWLHKAESQPVLETGARRFALTLGRTMELALLLQHSRWSIDQEPSNQRAAVAIRFASHGVDLITEG
jgi:acyl-CoA dehydrogenase